MIDFSGFVKRASLMRASLPPYSNSSEQWVDGLHCRIYNQSHFPENILIVYHGGGVNVDAGYDILARQIIDQGCAAVCLVDIRGHGRSIGNPGQVNHPQHIWQDVDRILNYLTRLYPQSKLHLFGHSSGGGMLINYFTRHLPQEKVTSLVLLAPEFGPFAPADLRNPSHQPFAEVKQWPFILNALSRGLFFGHYPAVKLNFPDHIHHNHPDVIDYYSVNMANALTPRNPQRQLAKLALPVTVLVGEKDELFNAEAVVAYIKNMAISHLNSQIIQKTCHLECLFDVCEALVSHLEGLASLSQRDDAMP